MSGLPRSKISEIITSVKSSNSRTSSRHSFSMSSLSDIDLSMPAAEPKAGAIEKRDIVHNHASFSKEITAVAKKKCMAKEESKERPCGYATTGNGAQELRDALARAEEKQRALLSDIGNLTQKIKDSEMSVEV